MLFVWVIATLFAISFLLIGINIWQNGNIVREGTLTLTSEEVQYAKRDLVEKLSKREVFKLWQRGTLPTGLDLSGDYEAYNLPQGVLSGLVNFITNHLFGPGKWVGKGFHEDFKTGYNIFKTETELSHSRDFEISKIKSEIDGRSSLSLDYRNLQKGFIAGSMRDEIRKINKNLFIGMGMTSWGLGSKNPAHFILVREDSVE